ncbi:MAG: hypothetical protein OEY49_08100 [Candidatus Heimdallarchaeota archaeon]|nr:hypothetical protein [Candidatus Heimdallarchaeota archaeon]
MFSELFETFNIQQDIDLQKKRQLQTLARIIPTGTSKFYSYLLDSNKKRYRAYYIFVMLDSIENVGLYHLNRNMNTIEFTIYQDNTSQLNFTTDIDVKGLNESSNGSNDERIDHFYIMLASVHGYLCYKVTDFFGSDHAESTPAEFLKMEN